MELKQRLEKLKKQFPLINDYYRQFYELGYLHGQIDLRKQTKEENNEMS